MIDRLKYFYYLQKNSQNRTKKGFKNSLFDTVLNSNDEKYNEFSNIKLIKKSKIKFLIALVIFYSLLYISIIPIIILFKMYSVDGLYMVYLLIYFLILVPIFTSILLINIFTYKNNKKIDTLLSYSQFVIKKEIKYLYNNNLIFIFQNKNIKIFSNKIIYKKKELNYMSGIKQIILENNTILQLKNKKYKIKDKVLYIISDDLNYKNCFIKLSKKDFKELKANYIQINNQLNEINKNSIEEEITMNENQNITDNQNYNYQNNMNNNQNMQNYQNSNQGYNNYQNNMPSNYNQMYNQNSMNMQGQFNSYQQINVDQVVNTQDAKNISFMQYIEETNSKVHIKKGLLIALLVLMPLFLIVSIINVVVGSIPVLGILLRLLNLIFTLTIFILLFVAIFNSKVRKINIQVRKIYLLVFKKDGNVEYINIFNNMEYVTLNEQYYQMLKSQAIELMSKLNAKKYSEEK